MVIQRQTGIDYDLGLIQAHEAILSEQPKTVLVQLAEGLRPFALEIIRELEAQHPQVLFVLWAGSCFGSCDVPPTQDFDLLLAFGHSKWPFWT